jgi:hypothetical protein
MSARAQLARLVLQMLALGESVSTHDALQLRSWALTPEDAMLPLELIALHILSEETESHAQLKIRDGTTLKYLQVGNHAPRHAL